MQSIYPPAAVDELTCINLQDMFISFGWEKLRFGRQILEWPFRSPAQKFARLVLDYDHFVADFGLCAGSARFLKQLNYELLIEGRENIPPAGPLMVLSNHPGMADTVSLFASIPRPGLKVVAAERPFLQALPATDRQLIYVPDGSEGRMQVLKAIAAQLRAGGAILTFPAGQIEPDPASLPGSLQSLDSWSSSIGALVRVVPASQIVIAIVSGVLAPQSLRHPLTYLRRQRKDRERLAATIQLLALIWFPHIWNLKIRVRFSPPIPAADLVPLKDPELITRALVERIRPFVASCANT